MNGQWIGTYSGSNNGEILVNVDERPFGYQGVAYLNDADTSMPNLAAFFAVEGNAQNFSFKTRYIAPVNPNTGSITDRAAAQQVFGPNISLPEFAVVAGKWSASSLSMSWTTDIGTSGTCDLPCSQAAAPSKLVPLERVVDWSTFKDYVSTLDGRRFLFRGQNAPWRLRTSFHRTGRADLHRFLDEDIQMLHKHLSARTRHVFNLAIPDENGAFFNLVQHHGYPTPLLDWTYSPYVAAFFAYRGISNAKPLSSDGSDKVRIFVFDQMKWKHDLPQLKQLLHPGKHVSINEFMAIENERMIPQQAVSTLTSVDDIESYIQSKGSTYLWAIDLPVLERQDVVKELSFMGITAGALFPGLDGACEELRARNFEA